MTDDQHGEGMPQGGGRWDPLPQGDYDDGATAFVKLPEGGIDALLASADSPLAAPGHGYVPPPITADPATADGTGPAAAGGWAAPAAPVDGAQWHDPNAGHQQHDPHGGAGQHGQHGQQAGQHAGDDRFTYNPAATGQWHFDQATAAEAAPASGQDVTGQWSIPVAGGDLPDESGEFTTSSLVEQWGSTPPATLPGGAPAPWAPQAVGQPWGQETAETTGAGHGHDQPAGTGYDQPAGTGYEQPAPHTGERSAGHGPEQPMPAGQDPEQHPPAEPGPDTRAPEPETAGHAGEQPDAPAPEHAPSHAEESGDPHVETSQHTPGAGEAAEDTQAPDAAAESPAESPADPAPAPDAEPAPEAAEEPVTATGPETPAESGPAAPQEPAPTGSHDEHPLASYVLSVNGTERPVTDAWIGESLLYVLRERLGLAGAKDGCSQGECGACNVQVDGRLVASCLVPAVTAAGSEVRTVEGLAADGQPSDVQRALARCGAVQCGFCVPGMAMTLHDLLEGNPAPTELEARQALCGNLCRCSGYRGVLEAVKEVVAEREAHSAPDEPESDADEPRIPHQAGPGAGGVHPSAFESPGPHDQPYGQDGGHA
ncbi:2Fe-2S iron-sulfur cluster-binding protein [Streptomyces sp. S.PNR 29]|uniref:2Fe-2S iron-sulfur cluster-binding protein n=1 Tax=Streptomyces sp. S.PNR 29 TaxID=2973805 RepID=UPI0025B0565D|nr:2Fe-2S iron-sulfur cluster-binding protein [Streptomyces sp. S.PNR 29]MDN0197143.1 2Fe-2S iron-sulfur cluster-binding protein [Streptomyces sp. S.PNR 29]